MSISPRVSVPIDVAISQAYGTIEDDAAADLRDIIDRIDANSKKKETLRAISDKLALVRSKVEANQLGDAQAELNELLSMLDAAGYGSHTALGEVASTPPAEAGANANGDMVIDSLSSGDDAITSIKSWLDDIETVLKGELDRHSDISSKYQVELNTKSSILRRSQKAVADNESAFQKNGDAIQRKMDA